MNPHDHLETSPDVALLDGNLRMLLTLRDEAADPDVLARLAAAWNARAAHERALEVAEEGLEMDAGHGDLWWERIRAGSLGAENDLDDQATRLLGVHEAHPEDPAPARNLGLLYYYLGEDDLCEKWCRKALELDPEDSRAHEVLAYMAFSADDLERAIEESAQAVELDPRNHRAYHWLAECHLRSDAPEAAERYLLRALEEEEYDFLALTSLGDLYLQRAHTLPLGVQCYSRILSVNPRNWMVYLRFVEHHLSEGHHLEALAECMRLLSMSPDRRTQADAWQYAGLIHYLEENDEDAEDAFEAAIEADEDFPAPWHYLGLLAERAGELEHAEELFRKALDLDPDYAFSLVRLGYLYFDRGRQEEALRFFRRALEADPDEYMAHLGISEVMRARSRHEDQLEHARLAYEIAPTDGNVLNQLGIAYESLDRLEEASESYRAALRHDPMNRHAANNLGYLLERLLGDAADEEAQERLRQEAVDAWRRRLLICRDEEVSIHGARRHLRELGVPSQTIEDWLLLGSVEEGATEEGVH